MELEIRDTQTIVKHEILQDYLKGWGSIITNGLKPVYEQRVSAGKSFKVKLIYVDCFSSIGRYANPLDKQNYVPGSPIIGIQALEEIQQSAYKRFGFRPETVVILIEEKQQRYEELLKTLEVYGLSSRVQEVKNDSSLAERLFPLKNGDIATIEGDCCNYIDPLLNLTTQPYTWAFYLLDPYGPSGIPLSSVGSIISKQHHDVMINFPYQDLHKKTGSVVRETPEHELHLHYYDAMYGSNEWRSIALNLQRSSDEMETELVRKYVETLQGVDQDVAVKRVPLLFPDKERTMFYLFLTTHDPTGGLTINEILDDAKLQEYDLRVQWKTEKERDRSGGYFQTTMFDSTPTIEPKKRPSKEDVASHLYSLCQGESIEYREVLRRVINTQYHHKDIRGAMSLLKHRGQVDYKALQNSERVSFK